MNSSPIFELSAGQRSIWFGQSTCPGTATYQCGELIRFPSGSDVDAARLARIIRRCISQLPVFTAEYVDGGVSGPIARRGDEDARISVEVLDSAQIVGAGGDLDPDADLDAEVELAARRFIARPTGSELRGADLTAHQLITHADGRLWWVARFHHIAGDGFSFNALLTWITQCYTAESRGEELPESPFTLPEPADRAVSPETVEFWREHTLPEPGISLLPDVADSPDPVDADVVVSGAALLPADARKQLRTLLQGLNSVAESTAPGSEHPIEHPTELDLVMLLTSRYIASLSNAEELSIGIPLMNRTFGRKVVECGPAVSVMPLCVNFAAASSAAALLQDLSRELRAIREHSSIGVDQLRALTQRTDPTLSVTGPHVNFRPFTPAFRCGSATGTLSTLSVGPLEDIEIIFQSARGGALEIMVMARGVHHSSAVQAHADRLAHVLTQAAELTAQSEFDPAAEDFGTVQCVLPEEFQQVINDFNATEHELPGHRTLREMLLSEHARITDHGSDRSSELAQQPLLIFHDPETDTSAHLNHDELWQLATSGAQQLKDCGIGPGDVVALHLRRSPEFIIAVAATILAGAAWVPIDPDIPVARRRSMLTRCNARLAVSAYPNAELELPTILTSDDGHLTPWILSSTQPEDHAPSRAVEDTQGIDVAYVLFTSGSTGTPKAVAVPQEGIVNRLEWMCAYYDLPAQRMLHKTPLTFDVSVWEYLLPLTHSIPTVIAPPQAHLDLQHIERLLRDHRVNFCHFVPSALAAFLPQVCDLPDLQQIITSGEALPAHLAQQTREALDVEVHNLYGPTEASIDVSAHTVDDSDQVIPIGTPVWNTALYVLDRWNQPVPAQFPGMLHIAGRQVALGYMGQPELTAEKFIADPFPPAESTPGSAPQRCYNTGDIARWRPSGTLDYLGRSDGQVKLRGQRLELGEVTSVVESAPGIARAATVIREVAGSPALVAYVVLAPENPQTENPQNLSATIKQWCAKHLPDYMVPSFVVPLESMPLTVNGKLNATELPAPELPTLGSSSAQHSPHPSTPASIYLPQVISAWRRILELPAETNSEHLAHANFFELGGNSLSAVLLAAEIPNVTVADVFAHPTPVALAQRAEQPRTTGSDLGPAYAELLTLRPHRHGTPVVCVHPAGGLGWVYAGLLPHLHSPDVGVYVVQTPAFSGGELPRSIDAAVQRAATLIEDLLTETGCDTVDVVGWSIGGVLAQHLAATRPSVVARLLLLDAYPAAAWRQLPMPNQQEMWRAVLDMAGISTVEVEESTLDQEAIAQLLADSQGVYAHLPSSVLKALPEVVEASSRAMREHTTQPSQVPTWHFTALQKPDVQSTALQANKWADVLGECTEFLALDVTHPGMVGPLGFQVVAEILRD
ncbi:non-ribosomal peptide synthetase [Corynebacterium suicordis]|uniref:Amino acid adenylation domain-containing protein n=1 Tax=Corynebacterium suicordis DSM 45110 TaxID=1121369 RepID=A0ABR9ZL80_9CORY|nr:non-ribosomal peptide synthetase [Corynebacterium suicordis]MBF4554195.1 amino acid adenylation domain-containing protein [Corynebacterium suicordis DSM 45110]MDR6276826.1 enterobactin synthetase component F [Corynebacterium suicordis]